MRVYGDFNIVEILLVIECSFTAIHRAVFSILPPFLFPWSSTICRLNNLVLRIEHLISLVFFLLSTMQYVCKNTVPLVHLRFSDNNISFCTCTCIYINLINCGDFHSGKENFNSSF